MIELKNVAAAKSGRKLFQNFDFQIHKGEHWLIQGRNGAGKTTLLQLLSGGLTPLSGRVDYTFIEHGDWDTVYRQRQEKIHLIPTHWIQNALAGFSDLFYQQRYYSVEETDLPKVRDIFGEDLHKLASFGFSDNFRIDQLLELQITRLSNGQLKKVIILRQLVKSIPSLLLLDYPFDGLDADSRTDLARFIDDIVRQFDIHIVLVDHGDTLPSVINRRLVLEQFAIKEKQVIKTTPSRPSIAGPSDLPVRTESNPVVEMQNVTIKYNGKKIISNLNWRVNKGERWALTGKNGSGKTTLFSLIYADHPMAYSQKVFLFGNRRGSGESIWDIKKRINYLGPEQIHFLDSRTRNISAYDYIRAQSHQELERLDELIKYFDAGHYIDTPLHLLSSGHLQMVLLMNMFLDDKELLLLDEPFQFLDPINRGKVTEYLNHFLDEKITLIMITHDENDVARWTQLRKVL